MPFFFKNAETSSGVPHGLLPWRKQVLRKVLRNVVMLASWSTGEAQSRQIPVGATALTLATFFFIVREKSDLTFA